MKVYRSDEAAQRLGLSEGVLDALVSDGLVEPTEQVGDVRYFSQVAIDRLIQDLHCRIQRASWSDIELRMESVERRLEEMEEQLKQHRGQRLI